MKKLGSTSFIEFTFYFTLDHIVFKRNNDNSHFTRQYNLHPFKFRRGTLGLGISNTHKLRNKVLAFK